MGGSTFTDKLGKPDEQMLETELAGSFPFNLKICQYIKKNFGELTTEWKYYGKKHGWLLKLLLKKRNILFINPQTGHFKTTFTFGEKALVELIDGDIDSAIKNELLKSKKIF